MQTSNLVWMTVFWNHRTITDNKTSDEQSDKQNTNRPKSHVRTDLSRTSKSQQLNKIKIVDDITFFVIENKLKDDKFSQKNSIFILGEFNAQQTTNCDIIFSVLY
jgi:hypothetical protein